MAEKKPVTKKSPASKKPTPKSSASKKPVSKKPAPKKAAPKKVAPKSPAPKKAMTKKRVVKKTPTRTAKKSSGSLGYIGWLGAIIVVALIIAGWLYVNNYDQQSVSTEESLSFALPLSTANKDDIRQLQLTVPEDFRVTDLDEEFHGFIEFIPKADTDLADWSQRIRLFSVKRTAEMTPQKFAQALVGLVKQSPDFKEVKVYYLDTTPPTGEAGITLTTYLLEYVVKSTGTRVWQHGWLFAGPSDIGGFQYSIKLRDESSIKERDKTASQLLMNMRVVKRN